jgi:hypothetical protein
MQQSDKVIVLQTTGVAPLFKKAIVSLGYELYSLECKSSLGLPAYKKRNRKDLEEPFTFYPYHSIKTGYQAIKRQCQNTKTSSIHSSVKVTIQKLLTPQNVLPSPLSTSSHHPTPAATSSSGTCDLIPSTIRSNANLSAPVHASCTFSDKVIVLRQHELNS